MMQYTDAPPKLLTFATYINRVAKLLAGWKSARARRADERLIRRAAARLDRLSPHYLDDIGLAHLAAPPRPDWRDWLPHYPRS
ncbi:MAG: hypothetical protein ACOH2H_21560 [Cypionkella sp.]